MKCLLVTMLSVLLLALSRGKEYRDKKQVAIKNHLKLRLNQNGKNAHSRNLLAWNKNCPEIQGTYRDRERGGFILTVTMTSQLKLIWVTLSAVDEIGMINGDCTGSIHMKSDDKTYPIKFINGKDQINFNNGKETWNKVIKNCPEIEGEYRGLFDGILTAHISKVSTLTLTRNDGIIFGKGTIDNNCIGSILMNGERKSVIYIGKGMIDFDNGKETWNKKGICRAIEGRYVERGGFDIFRMSRDAPEPNVYRVRWHNSDSSNGIGRIHADCKGSILFPEGNKLIPMIPIKYIIGKDEIIFNNGKETWNKFKNCPEIETTYREFGGIRVSVYNMNVLKAHYIDLRYPDEFGTIDNDCTGTLYSPHKNVKYGLKYIGGGKIDFDNGKRGSWHEAKSNCDGIEGSYVGRGKMIVYNIFGLRLTRNDGKIIGKGAIGQNCNGRISMNGKRILIRYNGGGIVETNDGGLREQWKKTGNIINEGNKVSAPWNFVLHSTCPSITGWTYFGNENNGIICHISDISTITLTSERGTVYGKGTIDTYCRGIINWKNNYASSRYLYHGYGNIQIDGQQYTIDS